MKEGDIITARLIQADRLAKSRPVLLLKRANKLEDYIVCGISTQVEKAIDGLDIIVDPATEKYKGSGLIKLSVIRLTFLDVIAKHDMEAAIGYLPAEQLQEAKSRLAKFILTP